MKIHRPIGDAEWRVDFAKAIARCEHAIAVAENWHWSDQSKSFAPMARIRAAFLAHDQPLTASEALALTGLTEWATSKPPGFAHRVARHLERLGWIQRVGTVERQWRSGASDVLTSHQVLVYVRTEQGGAVRQRERMKNNAIRQLLRTVERLDQSRQSNHCLVQRIVKTARPTSARNREIIARRLRGERLQDIADDFGLSRERARQIVERSIVARMKRGRKPKAPETLPLFFK